jgi:lysophospholipase L1-like esterase
MTIRADRFSKAWTVAIAGVVVGMIAVAAIALAAAKSTGGSHRGLPKPPPGTYVALGDSYASGTGAPPYDPAEPTCQRSGRSYGRIVGSQLRRTTIVAACSGASIADVVAANGQIKALSGNGRVGLVTLTIGGNDIDFAGGLTACVLQGCAAAFVHNQTDEISQRIEALEPHLVAAYSTVKRDAPTAEVVVVDYPRFLTGRMACEFLSADSVGYVNAKLVELDNAIVRAASTAHVHVMDVRDAFAGHELCSPSPTMMNGVQLGGTDSAFHPTVAGYAREAVLLAAALR